MISVQQRKVLLLAASLGAAWLGAGGPARAGDRDPMVFRERGDASVYGDELQGKRTASGARFDQREPMAAHPSCRSAARPRSRTRTPARRSRSRSSTAGPTPRGAPSTCRRAPSAARRRQGDQGEGDAEVLIEATRDQVEEAIDTPGDERKVRSS
jgi:hypothetical protein